MIDLVIGMSVLGVALLFTWSLGYKMGYDRGIEDCDEIYEIFDKDE